MRPPCPIAQDTPKKIIFKMIVESAGVPGNVKLTAFSFGHLLLGYRKKKDG